MKKIIFVIAILMVIMGSAFGFSACGSKDVTITFEGFDLAKIDSITVPKGTVIEKPQIPIPSDDSFFFDEWFSDKWNPFNFNSPIDKNTTIYIGWEHENFEISCSYKNKKEIAVLYPHDTTKTSYEIPTNENLPLTYEGLSFSDCANLSNITLPQNLKSINSWMFQGCSSLTEITLPNGLTTIKKYAFEGAGLEKIIIPDSVTTIEALAFSDCVNLAEVTLSNQLSSLEDYAFSNTKINTIVIPNSLTIIGEGAFNSCNFLLYITLPESLKTIGEFSFDSCRRLSEITIPVTVTNIGANAFRDCDLITIKCKVANQPVGWDIKWNPDGRPVIWNA